MSGAPTPVFIPEAFAKNASGGFINTIPDTTSTPGAASWSLGFPPLTMTPKVSGGKPPFGQDMNGVLYALSTWAFAQQSGQAIPKYNGTVATAVGGYAQGTLLLGDDNFTVYLSTIDANSNNPNSTTTGWIPLSKVASTVSISGLTGGIRTLTAPESARYVIVLSGALVGAQTIVLPNQVGPWLIVNLTTGSFTTTVRTAAGTGVAVLQGGFSAPVEVYGDGTNIYPTVAPLTIPTAEGPVPSTYPIRSNAGYIYATYFNGNGAQEPAATIVNVMIDSGDGFFRKKPLANFTADAFVDAALTGNPTAPTQAVGNNSTRIATTAFVQAASAALNGGGYIDATGSPASILPAGWTVFRVSAGRYRLTFPFTLSTSVHGVAITANPILVSSDDRYCNILAPTTTTVDIEVVDSGSGNVDNAVYFTYSRIAA